MPSFTSAPDMTSFNPTLVRLRRGSGPARSGPYPGFNPTLVRLRQDAVLRHRRLPVKFQSHAGSIEATLSELGGRPASAFQSHAGSIEALIPPTHIRVPFIVSIPRWFD